MNWGQIEATIEESKIHVVDAVHEVNDDLEFRDRIINMSLGFNYLVATTNKQCTIYNVMNWDSPAVFDIKEPAILILQGPKNF